VLTNPALREWQSGGYIECARAKRRLLSELEDVAATESWKAEWELALTLLHWLSSEASIRAQHRASPFSLSPKEVFNRFYDALCLARGHYKPLEKLMHELKLTSIE